MFQKEIAVAKDLNSKMHYFDGIKRLSNILVEESTGLLDVTKGFKTAMEGAKYELDADFTDDEIDE
jgi:hypothetical protein